MTDDGAGEILLTSMDRDGTKQGFDIPLTRAIADAVAVPVIASGGVGGLDHLVEGVIKGTRRPFSPPRSSISARLPSPRRSRTCAGRASRSARKRIERRMNGDRLDGRILEQLFGVIESRRGADARNLLYG